jgi:molybdate transport system ATP-binding protein
VSDPTLDEAFDEALDIEIEGAVGRLEVEVSLRVARDPLVVVGPNGAGKTTLLMMILGATPPRRGRITLARRTLYDGAARVDVPVEARLIGYVPQRYALFPHLDVLGNVAYGLRDLGRDERRQTALGLLADLGLEGLAARSPAVLSGGESQSVALARALASRPRALLLDEPMAALDVGVRRQMRRFLSERVRALGIPSIVVTHDRRDAEAFGGEVVVLERGAVVQRGPLADLAARPATEFVHRFVERVPDG